MDLLVTFTVVQCRPWFDDQTMHGFLLLIRLNLQHRAYLRIRYPTGEKSWKEEIARKNGKEPPLSHALSARALLFHLPCFTSATQARKLMVWF